MRRYLAVAGLSLALACGGGAALLYALSGLSGAADWRLWCACGLLLAGATAGGAAGWLLSPAWRRAGLWAGLSLSLPLTLLLLSCAPGIFTWPVLLAAPALVLPPALLASLLAAGAAQARQILRRQEAPPPV